MLALRNEDRKAIADIPIVRDLWRDQLVYAGALLRTFLGSYVDDGKFAARVVADGVEQRWTGLTERHSDLVSASSIELEEQPGQPLHAQLDGEELPATTRVRIDVAARALRLIVPAEFAGA